ncbi:hypothetical protein ACQKH5_00470 [Hyphomonas sp. NPDC076900]|uniref:hypothetical protein n=1 Tax=unclassified Hyphomonas TaxID=2630699 RepID=UPI003CFD79CB
MFTRRSVLTGLSGFALAACAHRADALRVPAASARRRIEDLVYSAMVPAAGLVVCHRGEVVFAHAEGLAQGAAGEADRAPFTPETAFCAPALSPLAAVPFDPRFAARGAAATLYTREDEGLWQVQTEAGECTGASLRGLASLARAAGQTPDFPGVQTYEADTSPVLGVKLIGHQGEAYGSYSGAFHAPDLEVEIAFAVTGTSVSGRGRSVHHPVMIKATEPLWAAAESLLAAF